MFIFVQFIYQTKLASNKSGILGPEMVYFRSHTVQTSKFRNLSLNFESYYVYV